MNFSKILTLPVLLCAVPSVGFAGSYINNYGDFHKTDERGRTIEVSYNDGASSRHSDSSDISVRFFTGLEASLLQYETVRATADGYREKDYNVKINHDVLENTGFMFGTDINDGYRVYLLLSHYNDKEKVNGVSTRESQTNLGLALDIPVLKQKYITPFIRLGLEYVWAEANSMKAHGLGYMVGAGISHNFTDNIFGTLSLTYEFAHPDVRVSGTDLSYKQDALVLGVGLGYRF